jgi:hypothetical protein
MFHLGLAVIRVPGPVGQALMARRTASISAIVRW